MIPCFGIFYTLKKAFFCNLDQFFRFFTDFTDRMCSCCIGMISFMDQPCIQTDNITFMNDSVFIRNSMNNFLVHRYTDRCRVSIVIQERRNTSIASDDFLPQCINILGTHSRVKCFFQFIMYTFEYLSGFRHQFDFSFRFNRDCHSLMLQVSLQLLQIHH